MSTNDFMALADYLREHGWELMSAETTTEGDVAREWSGFTKLKLTGFQQGRITSTTKLQMVALRSNFEAHRWLGCICNRGEQLLPHLIVTDRGATAIDNLNTKDRRGETVIASIEVEEIAIKEEPSKDPLVAGIQGFHRALKEVRDK